jgi:phage shock protein C
MPGGRAQLDLIRKSRQRATMPLQRSRTSRKIAGVCGGIAEWVGWDPTIVRIVYVLASIFSAAFPGVIVYLVLWILMPKAPREPRRAS